MATSRKPATTRKTSTAKKPAATTKKTTTTRKTSTAKKSATVKNDEQALPTEIKETFLETEAETVTEITVQQAQDAYKAFDLELKVKGKSLLLDVFGDGNATESFSSAKEAVEWLDRNEQDLMDLRSPTYEGIEIEGGSDEIPEEDVELEELAEEVTGTFLVGEQQNLLDGAIVTPIEDAETETEEIKPLLAMEATECLSEEQKQSTKFIVDCTVASLLKPDIKPVGDNKSGDYSLEAIKELLEIGTSATIRDIMIASASAGYSLEIRNEVYSLAA